MNITTNEMQVIENIAINEMNSANWGIPEEAGDTWTWVDCVADLGHHNLKSWGKKISGVISSLVKKGLASTNGESIGLTEKGFQVFKTHKAAIIPAIFFNPLTDCKVLPLNISDIMARLRMVSPL